MRGVEGTTANGTPWLRGPLKRDDSRSRTPLGGELDLRVEQVLDQRFEFATRHRRISMIDA